MINQDSDIIKFKVLLYAKEYELSTCKNEYRNLMLLLNDKLYIEDFGQCGGMGRCGTCLIEIKESHQELTSLDRNEQVTLKKLNITESNTRLSCQLLIDATLDGATAIIV